MNYIPVQNEYLDPRDRRGQNICKPDAGNEIWIQVRVYVLPIKSAEDQVEELLADMVRKLSGFGKESSTQARQYRRGEGYSELLSSRVSKRSGGK